MQAHGIDLDRERALTPGCTGQVFLDSAGSSLMPAPVVEQVVAHLRREAEIGGYRAAHERLEDLASLPAAIGRLIGADASEIALSDSATRSWNEVVTSLDWKPGDRVLVCGNEYASNAIALLQRARQDGVRVEVVPDLPEGGADLDALAGLLDERVRLVSVVHVATNSGRIAAVRAIADAAHDVGALMLLDACQSVGQLVVDVDVLGADALSATGRKWLRGPRGTGFLYLRDGLPGLDPAAPDLRGATWTGAETFEVRADAARFELWEHDVAARLGLLAAVSHLETLGPAQVEDAVRAGAGYLRDGLGAIAGVTVRDLGPEQSGLVTFTVEGTEPNRVRDALARHGVTVSVSHAGSTRLDMDARGLAAVVRASPHYFNSRGDLDAALAAIATVAAVADGG